MVPFPLYEIYYHVLNGWKIEELYRGDDFIKVTVYMPSRGMEEFMKLTGCDLEDVINQTKHFEFYLVEVEEE